MLPWKAKYDFAVFNQRGSDFQTSLSHQPFFDKKNKKIEGQQAENGWLNSFCFYGQPLWPTIFQTALFWLQVTVHLNTLCWWILVMWSQQFKPWLSMNVLFLGPIMSAYETLGWHYELPGKENYGKNGNNFLHYISAGLVSSESLRQKLTESRPHCELPVIKAENLV